ncbi:MAG: AarF/UbiB family protein [Vicinamibacterales bacterium]
MSGSVARLSRYRDVAWFAAKYGRADFAQSSNPEAFARDLESLGPTFIKLGQLLSTRGDLLPPPYIEALSRLQDDLEPFPFAEVERIVQEELGVRLSKAFDTFEPTPTAAASLGQVHRATLRGGRAVAVKVQRPGVRERVLADLESIDGMATLLELSRSGTQHGVRMPPELALLGKALLNLDEIGRVLDADFDVNASLRRNASSLMRRRMLKSASPASLFTSALEVREFAGRLPGRVNRILDALAGSELRLKVEVIDQGSILDGLQKVANRIALGLVLAALIVGAAMLMRVETPFTILGYPGLAMLLFLAAAAGALWMAWTILVGDVRRVRGRG